MYTYTVLQHPHLNSVVCWSSLQVFHSDFIRMDNKTILTVIVTEEQRLAIEAFFGHSGWDLEIVREEPVLPTVPGNQLGPTNGRRASGTDPHPMDSETGADNQGDSNVRPTIVRMGPKQAQNISLPESDYEPDANACPYCYLNPCVTTFRQGWLGNGQAARKGNNGKRKEKYKKFWSLIGSLGGWNHPLYLEKKNRALQHEASTEEFVWEGGRTLREIMPECVLKLVRGLYPNLPGQDYMGHMWW